MYVIEIQNDSQAHLWIKGSREEFAEDLKHFKDVVPWEDRYFVEDEKHWILNHYEKYEDELDGMKAAIKQYNSQLRMF